MSIQPSYHIFIDFCTVVTSKTQPEPKLMHPSVATALNKKKRIDGKADVDELIDELGEKNIYSELILTHNAIRTPDGDSIISSALKIEQLLTVYMYILLEDFE